MQLFRVVIIWLVLTGLPVAGWSAEPALGNPAADSAAHPSAAAHEQHGLTAHAVELWKPFGFPITNSMVVTWVVALGLIIFAQIATRNMKMVPEGAQNFIEWLVESLYNFLEGVIGHVLVRKTFWFFATIFIFILFCNWLGLIPGFGTIGYGVRSDHGFHVAEPWFRGANADMNMTLAMSMTFFACWIVWALQTNGPVGFLLHLFAPK